MQEKRRDTIIDPEITIIQKEGAFCYSTDTLLLFDFIEANYDFSRQTKAIELGSGTGGLCIVLAKKHPEAKVTGIDIQPGLAELATESATLNGLSNVSFVTADLRSLSGAFYPESHNLVIMNPPYFRLGTGRVNESSEKAQAKHEIKCTLADVFRAAGYLVKKTGSFILIHHYSRVYDAFELASKNKMRLAAFQPVYLSPKRLSEDATHCLFHFVKSHRKEPRVLPPRYIRND